MTSNRMLKKRKNIDPALGFFKPPHDPAGIEYNGGKATKLLFFQ
jgi:hypothetical protein